MMNINQALDTIHERKDKMKAAQEAAQALDILSIKRAAACVVSALITSVPDTVRGDAINIAGQQIILKNSTTGIVDFSDIGQAFSVEGANISGTGSPNSLRDFLQILQIGRDHTESIFFLPPDMREKRYDEIGGELNTSPNFVRFILANYPALERAVFS